MREAACDSRHRDGQPAGDLLVAPLRSVKQRQHESIRRRQPCQRPMGDRGVMRRIDIESRILDADGPRLVLRHQGQLRTAEPAMALCEDEPANPAGKR